MRNFIILIFSIAMLVATADTLFAQNQPTSYMARLYEDNDFMNDMGKGTDDAYTNGTRIDMFYNKGHKSSFFLDRWMPKAGDSSINTFGLGLALDMYTPKDITDAYYQRNDYAWSGGLYAIHSLYSYNPEKRYDFQTEVLAGVMGANSLAKPIQKIVHRIIADPSIPQGWNNQLNNDILLNANLMAEKELLHKGNILEVIGAAKVSVGTMIDGIDISPTIMIGKNNNYFNGFMAQHSVEKGQKLQAYISIKPGIQFVAWNSLLEGGMFSGRSRVKMPYIASTPENIVITDKYIGQERPQIENVISYISYSLVLKYGQFGLSYNQTHTSELVKNTYAHTYGNFTITYLL
jgi:lipid A 3-O-deacylase